MAIEITCPKCQQLLRVGDEQAGRQARCPKCTTVFKVPESTASQPRETPSTSTPSSSGSPAGASTPAVSAKPQGDGKRWFVKGTDGKQYGPVDKQSLDRWVAEGRITADSQVMEETTGQWQWASDIYPSLSGHQSAHASYGADSQNPYAAPNVQTSSHRRNLMAHRGGVVLTLGILGLVICGPLGIAAWIMGNSDLNDMKAGRMDNSGYGITQAGMVLGIISCCLMVLGCCGIGLMAAAGG